MFVFCMGLMIKRVYFGEITVICNYTLAAFRERRKRKYECCGSSFDNIFELVDGVVVHHLLDITLAYTLLMNYHGPCLTCLLLLVKCRGTMRMEKTFVFHILW